jgi:hypothetical protein
VTRNPFALSMSKGFLSSSAEGEGEGFDKLGPNGFHSLPQENIQ